ncbi:200_t:CDS:2 [Cetraspora pellucida]|uniref:200_t:CDS:1 n=1 Tax=Cetraspora pellucida TaxID=1433469 RepID=A0A9N8VKL9_9GLOM|nr:200_t:CDS:2 [Cetraspora pellucida]
MIKTSNTISNSQGLPITSPLKKYIDPEDSYQRLLSLRISKLENRVQMLEEMFEREKKRTKI